MNIVTEFTQVRASGCPWCLVVSYDPQATVRTLAAIRIPGLDDPSHVAWDLAAGHKTITGPDVDSELGEGQSTANKPYMLLQKAVELPPGTVLYIQVPSAEFWKNDLCVQALANLRDVFKSSSRTVVLLSTTGRLPEILARDVPVLREELPTVEQLKEMGEKVLQGNEIKHTKGDLEQAASFLRGMTLFAAENALARKCLADKIDMAGLRDSQRTQIEEGTGGALTFEREKWTFDDIGGMTAIKEFERKVLRNADVLVRIDEMDKVITAASTGAIADNTGTSQDTLRSLLTAIEDNRYLFQLLVGVPGCGKTLLTICAGNTYDKLTLAADLGKCKSSLLGASEAAIRQTLDTIKAIGGQRVLIVATANRLDTLPAELLSRAGACGIWFFDVPTPEEKANIWKIQRKAFGLQEQELPDDTDWVGRDIRNACRTAKLLNVPLVEASVFTMKTGVVSRTLVAEAREKAESCGYLSVNTPGPYTRPKRTVSSTRQIVGRATKTLAIGEQS